MSGIRVTCCPHATMASMTDKTQITLTAPASVDLALVVGPADSTLRVVESAFEASITVRGDSIILAGDQSEVQSLTALFSDFIKVAERGEEVTPSTPLRPIEPPQRGVLPRLREDIPPRFAGEPSGRKRRARSATSTPSAPIPSRWARPGTGRRPISPWRWLVAALTQGSRAHLS